MADFKSSLPVKTQNDGDVKAVIVDPTNTSNGIEVDSNGAIKAVAFGNNGTNDVALPIDPTSGALQVDITDASGITVDVNVEQYADGDAVNVANKGNLAIGTDGSNYQILSTDTNGALNVITPNPVQISSDGNANSSLNPIFVETVNAAASGDNIHQFGTTAAVAAMATHTDSYSLCR